jgi:hypothetical protein
MNLFEKFLISFEKDIYKAFGPKKQGIWFSGETYMQPITNDCGEVRELILKHNNKIRTYNSLSGHVSRLAQAYINSEALELATKPVDSFLDAVAERQRQKSIRKRPVFSGTDPYLAIQEARMNKLMDGNDGILAIRKRIELLRKKP